MKKTMFAAVLTLGIAALAGAMPADKCRITAPVAFTVGTTAMPAGVYDIEAISKAGLLVVTNTRTHAAVMVVGRQLDSFVDSPACKVTFTGGPTKYILGRVYLPSGQSFELPGATR